MQRLSSYKYAYGFCAVFLIYLNYKAINQYALQTLCLMNSWSNCIDLTTDVLWGGGEEEGRERG